MTLQEAGIREGSLVLLKPWADRQTVPQRLFRLSHWLSPGARTAAVGGWPGYHVGGCYALDGVWHGISTADIERLADDRELQALGSVTPKEGP
jgi:hypothetical protein